MADEREAGSAVVAEGVVYDPSSDNDESVVVGEDGKGQASTVIGQAPKPKVKAPARKPGSLPPKPQTVEDVDEGRGGEGEGQEEAAPEQAAGEEEPVSEADLRTLVRRLQAEVRGVQSKKDQEVAAAQAEAHRADQARLQAETERGRLAEERKQWEAWQKQQQEAETQREQEEFNRWWQTATPEQKQAYAAEEQRVVHDRQRNYEAARDYAMRLMVEYGVPAEVFRQALEEDGHPIAIKYALINHYNWQYWQEQLIQPFTKQIAVFKQYRAMTPDQKKAFMARATAGQKKAVQQGAQVVQQQQEMATAQRQGAPAPAPQPPQKAVEAEEEGPPAVTPGTSGRPPSSLTRQFQRAAQKGNIGEMRRLRDQLAESSGVDQTGRD